MYKNILKIVVCICLFLGIGYLAMLSLTMENMLKQQDSKINCIIGTSGAIYGKVVIGSQNDGGLLKKQYDDMMALCDINYLDNGVPKN